MNKILIICPHCIKKYSLTKAINIIEVEKVELYAFCPNCNSKYMVIFDEL